MTTYGIGNKYCLDLASLWEMFAAYPKDEGEIGLSEGKWLRFTIEDGQEYFDLLNYKDEIVCMDGEVCEILYEDEDLFELVEEDTQVRFKMTRREFEIACMA